MEQNNEALVFTGTYDADGKPIYSKDKVLFEDKEYDVKFNEEGIPVLDKPEENSLKVIAYRCKVTTPNEAMEESEEPSIYDDHKETE